MPQKKLTQAKKRTTSLSSKASYMKKLPANIPSTTSPDKRKTKDQLIEDLARLRRKTTRLEKTKDKLKQHEILLEESEDRFKKLYERAPLGYQSLDEIGYFKEVNEAWLNTFGYKKDEVIGKWFGDFLPDEYKDIFRRNFSEFKGRGSISGVEFEMLRKDGSAIIVSFDGKIGKDLDGNFLQTHCILQDITRQKAAEKALQKSEEKFRTLVENAPIAMSIINISGAIEFMNSKHLALTGYSHDDLPDLEHWWAKVYQDEDVRNAAIDSWKKFIASGAAGEDIGVVERKISCKDATLKDIELSFMRNEDKVTVIFSDVTGRKKAEEKIHESLNEKEVLLKEVHHCVKNNMAIISSLLALQAGYIDDKKYLDMFNESQSRIKSMALVHEKLYQSRDFAHIDVGDYVQSLVDNVKNTFVGDVPVISTVTVDPVDLDIDTLVPCGLIINELLTNAIKHAFEGNDRPEINLEMIKVDDNNVSLTITDNGKGLPEGFDIYKSTGLGLKLVRTLVKQISGTIQARSSGGTAFMLLFPEKHEPARRK